MEHFTVPPSRGTGVVKNPRMSAIINPSKAFGLNSTKRCLGSERAVRQRRWLVGVFVSN